MSKLSDDSVRGVFLSTIQYVKQSNVLNNLDKEEILSILVKLETSGTVNDRMENYMNTMSLLTWQVSKYKDAVERREVELKAIKDSFVSTLTGVHKPMQSSAMAQTTPEFVQCQSALLDLKRIHDYLKMLFDVMRDRKDMYVQISANERLENKTI